MTTPVAIVHDYLTQRGGAERVLLSMLKACPDAPVYTSLYDPSGTFPEFRERTIHTLAIDRIGLVRRDHRLALPVLAPLFGRLRIDAEVVLCSSSGWAHGVRTTGRKIVYTHSPAKWLYQPDRYLGRSGAKRLAIGVLRPYLVRWDRRAMAGADRCLVNSTTIRREVAGLYRIEAEVLPPPARLDPAGEQDPLDGVEPGFLLCVSRLLPYKNVDAVIDAFDGAPARRLVVVGTGPEHARLQARAPRNVRIVGSVTDPQLRWLYAHSAGLVAAAYEDFGLTPLEAARFGKPSAVLRRGGFLDTVRDNETGVFFERPTGEAIRSAVERIARASWDHQVLKDHSERFAEDRYIERLEAVVREERAEREDLSRRRPARQGEQDRPRRVGTLTHSFVSREGEETHDT